MKNVIPIVFLSALASLCGCTHPQPAFVGMAANINNTNWTAPSYRAQLDSNINPGVDTQRTITITGVDEIAPSTGFIINKEIELIILQLSSKQSVYVMSDTTCSAILTINNVSTTFKDGTISISSLTPTNVSGKFTFNNKTVSGQFNMPIK